MLVLGQFLHGIHGCHALRQEPIAVFEHLSREIKFEKKGKHIAHIVWQFGEFFHTEGKTDRISESLGNILHQIVLFLHPDIVDRLIVLRHF